MMRDRQSVWISALAIAAAILLLATFAAAGRMGVLEALPDLRASVDDWFTIADLDGAWGHGGVTHLDISGERGETWSGGYWSNDGDLVIAKAGRYALMGKLEDRSIVVDVGGNDQVWLLLDGVTVHRRDNAALRVERAGKVYLTLASGSENVLSNDGKYSAEASEEGVDGVLYSRDNLTINGDGALTLTSAAGHGIVCNDNLILAGGTISVTAERDGVHAHDSVRITGVSLTINARKDGISSSNDRQTGYIYIKDGTISIPTCYEGLEAVRVIIDGGDIDIRPRDDGINAPGWGAEDDIRIQGGNIQIINRSGRDADGFDSNKDVHITGGVVRISVPNDGSSNGIDFGAETGGVLKIDGGTLIACGSAGMADRASTSSRQASALINFRPVAAAGSQVRLLNSAGEEVLSWDAVPLMFNSVLITSPEMDWDETYTLIVGNMQQEVKTPTQLGTSGQEDDELSNKDRVFSVGGTEHTEPVPVGIDIWMNLALWVSILLAGLAVTVVVGGRPKTRKSYHKEL